MRIRLNAEEYNLEGDPTVEALMAGLKLDAGKIAVEVNRAIVPRSLYAKTPLSEGDAVEIVRFIGGG